MLSMQMQNRSFFSKLLHDSHYLFIRAFLLIYALSIFLYTHFRIYLGFVIMFSSILFIFYSTVRYAHYKRSFRGKKYIMRYIFEVLVLLIGVIYNLFFQFYYAERNVVNIVFCLSLVIFTLPTFIGTMKIRELEKK